MLDENAIIEKSRNVVAMQCLSLEENELKILDTYLSRIDPRNTETRYVTFTKTEYERLLGVERLDASRLNEYVKHLMQHIISIDTGMGWDNYCLFPTARFKRISRSENDSVGEYNIILDINHDLDPVFFNIASLGYIRYRLKYTLKLKNKYDMKTYLFLKTYEYSEPYTFTITLNNFKKKIECSGQSYEEYTIFNNRILKPAIKRINDLTDIKVEYKKPRKRSYEDEYIKFTVTRKKMVSNSIESSYDADIGTKQDGNTPIPYNIPKDVYVDEDFDLDVLKLKIASVYPDDEVKLLEILGKANIRYDSKKAKSPFLYYLGIVKKILEEPLTGTKEKAANQKPNSFHNFDQRDYDYDALLHEINNITE